jgi:hypothetical protein
MVFKHTTLRQSSAIFIQDNEKVDNVIVEQDQKFAAVQMLRRHGGREAWVIGAYEFGYLATMGGAGSVLKDLNWRGARLASNI